jgi:hypothetical protein
MSDDKYLYTIVKQRRNRRGSVIGGGWMFFAVDPATKNYRNAQYNKPHLSAFK